MYKQDLQHMYMNVKEHLFYTIDTTRKYCKTENVHNIC